MKVIYVTSDVTYVRDNYLHLLEAVTDPKRLPEGVSIDTVTLLTIPPWYIVKNVVGLIVLGAPRVAKTLWRNLVQAKGDADPRVRLVAERGLSLFRCANVNHEASVAHFRSRQPDLIVNMRTRNIYKDPVLAVPKIGCLNIHHGLLPHNRGTMCDLWAWSKGEPVGFSLHWMNAKIDDGDIVAKRTIDATRFRSYVDIPMASSRVEGECLLDCLGRIAREGHIVGEKNVSSGKPHTRNPNFAQIQDLRRRGLVL